MDILLSRILEVMPSSHGSKRDLALFLGINQNAITGWTSGRLKSYSKYAPQIAEYYGVSLDWLCGRSDEKNIKKEPTSAIADGSIDISPEHFTELWNKASPELRKSILTILEQYNNNQ